MDMNNAFLKDMNMYEIKKRYVEIVNTPVTYNAIIISLYGCYESYVDKLADLLLDHWASTIKSYEDLSAKLKNKHIKKSGEFLTHPRRFRNYELNENYRLTIKNIYIKLFLKCPIPIREYLNSFTIFINSSYFKITSSNHKVNMNN